MQFAWNLAQSLGLDDVRTWRELAEDNEKIDALTVLGGRAVRKLVEQGRCRAAHYRGSAGDSRGDETMTANDR